MNKKKGYGLDLGSYSLNYIELVKKGKKIIVTKLMHESTSKYLQEENTEEKFFRNYLLDNKKNASLINTSITDEELWTVSITLPKLKKNELKEILYNELENKLPFDIEEVYFDFVSIEDGKNITEHIAYCVKKDSVERRLELLTKIGVEPKSLEVDMLAGAATIEFTHDLKKKDYVILDLGRNSSRLAYISKGRLLYVITLPEYNTELIEVVVPLPKITEEVRSQISNEQIEESEEEYLALMDDDLVDNSSTELEKVEESEEEYLALMDDNQEILEPRVTDDDSEEPVKEDNIKVPEEIEDKQEPSNISTSPNLTVVNEFAEELLKSVDFINTTYVKNNNEIVRAFVIGGKIFKDEQLDDLNKMSDVEFELVDPLQKLDFDKIQVTNFELTEVKHTLHTAVGLALKELEAA